MKRLLRATEVLAWALFFAFAALILTVRFWVLPDIERYRDDIVAAVSRGIGLPVRVGRIDAGWLGLRPQITLSDVRIHDAQGREALVVPSIHNVVAWRSLLHGELRLHQLAIEGLRLAVRRDAAGDLYVGGTKLAKGGGGSGDAGFAGWLLGQSEIVVRNAEIEWRDELRNAPPLVLSALDMRIVSSGRSLSLGMTARPPAELGSGIDVRALIDAAGLRADTWSGKVFMQVGYTDLAAWRAWVDYPINVRQGQGALRVWVGVENGEPKALTADLALADVWASLGDELSPLALASLQGRVHGQRLADGVELSGKQLALAMPSGPQIPKTDFQIVWRPQGGGVIGASLVDLQAVGQLTESLPLPPQLSRMLADLAPRGRLTDARFEWSGPFDALTGFSARGGFADLAMQPREQIPGFSGLTGSFELSKDRGKLKFASRQAQVVLPKIMVEPQLALDSLNGELSFERNAAGAISVSVASLTFANAHASGNLYGTYTWTGEGPGTLDLSAVASRADGSGIRHYFPRILDEEARDWIRQAVVTAESSDVRIRVRGDLRDFPFADPRTGEFLVAVRFSKGVLNYAPGWPRVEDIDGELTFEREGLELVGRSATVLGARLSGIRVSVPTFKGPQKRVLVSGQADGATTEFIKYIAAAPPLARKAGDFVTAIKTEGRGKLRVKLELPLADLDKTKAEGEYEFADNRVKLMDELPWAEQANGRITFTDAGFAIQNLRARFLGGNVSAGGGTNARRGTVEITARGDGTVQQARAIPWLDHPLNKYVSGAFAYSVNVQSKDGLTRVSLDSPLRGVEIALPVPLVKSPVETLPLHVDLIPSAGGERDRIAITLGTLARVELARRKQKNEMQVQRTAYWLTPERDQPIRLPERPGTLVYGSLKAFDLERWMPLLSGDAQGQGQGNGPENALPTAVEVKFGTMDAFGRRFSNVALRAATDAGGWSANVKADEVSGDVSYRSAGAGKLVARLAHFTIPADTPAAAGGSPRAEPRPNDLPAIDLVADEFTFRGKQLGRVELVGRPEGDNWRLDSASMVNPEASLTGSGVWYAAPSRTTVNFDLQAGDTGGFLSRVGYRDLVKGGRSRLRGGLSWQGDPSTLDLPTLWGELEMQSNDGQFLEIEPGVGKLISLMSLQALPRRITLDFRDVFSKGFQFDRINSTAQVKAGVMKLNEFRMRGSAADVEMKGETDLSRETQNLQVRVVPSIALGDTAAIGIGIVNPVAGVAAAIAQRILKNPLGQIFAFDYEVSGTWADPKVAKIQPPMPEAPQLSTGQ